ncbi:MAG: hypothetical protein AAFX94_18340, partial [Myxococcota bacterium]
GAMYARLPTTDSALDPVVGSLAYMAPEVMQRSADAMCDAFSLGMVALELMIGRLPDRQSRSKFHLENRHRGGLKGIVAALVAPFPERRPMTLELVSELLAIGVADNFEVLGNAGEDSAVLNGDRVYQCPEEGESKSYRVPRAQRFLGRALSGEAIVASHRRVALLTADGPVTRFASDREFDAWAFAELRSGLWIRDKDRVVYLTSDHTALEVPAPIPGPMRAAVSAGRRLLGVCLPAGDTVLAVEGAAMGVLCGVTGRQVNARTLEFQAPVRELSALGGRLLALVGDSSGAQVLDVSNGATPIGESADPVDAVRLVVDGGEVQIASGITMRTDALFLAPMSESAKAV